LECADGAGTNNKYFGGMCIKGLGEGSTRVEDRAFNGVSKKKKID
jgi:hypothetical protein